MNLVLDDSIEFTKQVTTIGKVSNISMTKSIWFVIVLFAEDAEQDRDGGGEGQQRRDAGGQGPHLEDGREQDRHGPHRQEDQKLSFNFCLVRTPMFVNNKRLELGSPCILDQISQFHPEFRFQNLADRSCWSVNTGYGRQGLILNSLAIYCCYGIMSKTLNRNGRIWHRLRMD